MPTSHTQLLTISPRRRVKIRTKATWRPIGIVPTEEVSRSGQPDSSRVRITYPTRPTQSNRARQWQQYRSSLSIYQNLAGVLLLQCCFSFLAILNGHSLSLVLTNRGSNTKAASQESEQLFSQVCKLGARDNNSVNQRPHMQVGPGAGFLHHGGRRRAGDIGARFARQKLALLRSGLNLRT